MKRIITFIIILIFNSGFILHKQGVHEEIGRISNKGDWKWLHFFHDKLIVNDNKGFYPPQFGFVVETDTTLCFYSYNFFDYETERIAFVAFLDKKNLFLPEDLDFSGINFDPFKLRINRRTGSKFFSDLISFYQLVTTFDLLGVIPSEEEETQYYFSGSISFGETLINFTTYISLTEKDKVLALTQSINESSY
jgi:hypothetical protein